MSRSEPGTVFTPLLFASLGSRAAIDKTLQRQVARGALRRLARGIYDKPRVDPLLGAVAVGRLLGLSDQVPARVEFLTDGTSRTVKAGPMQIVLKRTRPRQMAAAGRTSGLVIQALRSLGREHVMAQRLSKLRRALPADQRLALLADVGLAPGWMQPMLHALADEVTSIRHVTKPGANLFLELGLFPAVAKRLHAASRKQINDTRALKQQLTAELSNWITEHRLKQADAAQIPRVSDVVNQKTAKITIDALVEMLSRVGKPVRLAVGR